MDEPIENGNARVLLEALNQGLGRPTEHIEVEAKIPASVQQLHAMSSAERRALLARLEAQRGVPLISVVPDDDAQEETAG